MRTMGSWMMMLAAAALVVGCGSSDKEQGEDTAPPQDTVEEVVAPPTDTPAPEDTPPQQDTGPETFTTGISAKGYGEYCTSSDACAEFGLTCITEGPDDLYAQCSSTCTDYFDCSEYHTCDLKLGGAHPQHICMTADYCSECEDDVQCMLPGMRCLSDEAGGGFCSPPCVPGTPSCDAGSRCVYQEDLGDFFCLPIWGTCIGDGAQCSPCRHDPDCAAGHMCLEMAYSKEKFCAKACETGDDCPGEMACVAGGPAGESVCYPTWHGTAVPSCYLGTEEFCNACVKDFHCKTGICFYSYSGEDGGYCSKECVAGTDCPDGMGCFARYDLYDNSLAGYACAPLEGESCANYLQVQVGMTE